MRSVSVRQVAYALGVGVSYILPRTPVSYDGKPVHVLKIRDDLHPSPSSSPRTG